MATPLSALLNKAPAEVMTWESSELDRLLAQTDGRVVLFGAGSIGRRALRELRGMGVQPLCFSDNNSARWGTAIESCELLDPTQAAQRHGADALFLVTIWNAAHWYVETHDQLRDMGCQHICTFSPLFWRFPQTFLPSLLNDLPSRVYAASDEVLAAEDLWADDDSRTTYRSLVRWYATGDGEHLPSRPAENTYFPLDLFRLTPSDVFVDCGAFDGDAIPMMPGHQEDLPHFHAIEADPLSLLKLEARIAELPLEVRAKMHIHCCAVGAERGRVRFDTTGGVDSKIADEGGVEVNLVPLDELFAQTPVTMIKMDIEGAEYDALRGARHVIERDRPILAVCVYHHQRDLWRLPLLAKSLVPDHKLFLRSYEGDGFQTVLYAVPPHRCLSGPERRSSLNRLNEIVTL